VAAIPSVTQHTLPFRGKNRADLIFRQTQPSMTLAWFLPRINCEEDHRPSSLDGREFRYTRAGQLSLQLF
jgi:hypothetical protein